MLVDIRLADIQADYKREQLARSYGKSGRKTLVEKGDTVLDGNPLWPELWARLSLLNR
ncbi:MAG TPA: hypothetical protein VK969_13875 [Acidimicrobiia bacterium]|nr:hypothetical protein [Acidimicrobiia bacterium]